MREIAVANRERDYLLLRAKEERELAEQAISTQAREAHLRLADGYEARASSDEPGVKPSDYVYARDQQHAAALGPQETQTRL